MLAIRTTVGIEALTKRLTDVARLDREGGPVDTHAMVGLEASLLSAALTSRTSHATVVMRCAWLHGNQEITALRGLELLGRLSFKRSVRC